MVAAAVIYLGLVKNCYMIYRNVCINAQGYIHAKMHVHRIVHYNNNSETLTWKSELLLTSFDVEDDEFVYRLA